MVCGELVAAHAKSVGAADSIDWRSTACRGLSSNSAAPTCSGFFPLTLVQILFTTTTSIPYLTSQASMADPATISTQFTQFYYSLFDGDRKNLRSLYVRSLHF